MKAFLQEVWIEMRRAAKQAPKMYFAPFIGAVRHTRLVLRQVARENAARSDR